jgi:hypothetical protein
MVLRKSEDDKLDLVMRRDELSERDIREGRRDSFSRVPFALVLV